MRRRRWRSVKHEEVYLKDCATPKEARRSLSEYLTRCNEARPHQALGYRAPAVMYRGNTLTPNQAVGVGE
jgi:putative transposase